MAKKRNRSNRPRPPAERRAPEAAPAAPPPPPPPPEPAPPPPKPARVREPVFWFGFEVAWAKLAAARVLVFGLLAIDAFLQLRHAPRYGAGDFNVGQLPFLDALGPGRVAYTIGQLVECYLFVLAALGVATRWIVPIATAIYAWLYFGSQLDSYQHHYLMVMVLVIACFVPWQRPAGATPATPVASWAVRLLLVQLAIVYLWAAISKIDLAWVNGRTLGSQLAGNPRTMIDNTVGFAVASVMVIAVELALAATVWVRRAAIFAAPLGIVFHLGIVASGLEIGLFAYLMLALYVLVVPDGVLVWLADQQPVLGLRRRAHAIAAARGGWAPTGAAIALGLGLAWLVRIELALAVALGVSVVPIALAVRAWRRGARPDQAVAAAHLAALALWCAADRVSTVAVDYYNFWGGSQRRLGNPTEAERAYRSLLDIAPDRAAGHYHLGRILVNRGAADEGVAHLREAQRLEPGRARAWIAEARWLATQGRIDDAIGKAKQASFAEPSSSDARALLQGLQTNRAAPPAAERDEPDPP